MHRRALLAFALGPAFSLRGEVAAPTLHVELDPSDPAKSRAWFASDPDRKFTVGYGKNGILPVGSSFRGGYSLLGRFRVNAILTKSQFQMEDGLVAASGKSREWLAENLFANMSSIDFDGNGAGGEYGDAFVGLAPVGSAAAQPFHFGEYQGVFRWYSYAIHGTQDESRVGRRVTGGCLNLRRDDLAAVVAGLALGHLVEIS